MIYHKSSWLSRILLGLALTLSFSPPAWSRKKPSLTHITVQVVDATTHKPIFQARLTLAFRDPQSRRGETISYSAKTNAQGKYIFSFIPMEPVLLVVTAPNHQTFGQQFNVTQENQTLRVNLNPPQPLR